MRLYLEWRAVRPTLCAWLGTANTQPEATAPRPRSSSNTMTILMNRSPGFPEHGGGQVQAHRLVGDETEIRRNILLLAAGIAVTFVLFLALPFMQVASPPVVPPVPLGPEYALPLPPKFDPPPPPITQEKPVEPVPLLTPPVAPVPFDLLFPGGTGGGPLVPFPVVTWKPEDIPTEFVDYALLDRVPNAIYTVAPEVPRGVRQGDNVVLEFIVTPEGAVTGIRVLSSTNPLCERPAMAAIATWRFEPGIKDNKPVSTRIRLPIRFNIGQ